MERLLGEMQQQDIAVWRANSRAELRELLATDRRGLIVSMIHKFEGIEKGANARDNIYVFIDEAHRSVAKELGTYLMAALPNSTIVGFTGTPIARTAHGEGTFKIFGADDDQGYMGKYSIAESIEDETTLPIRHMMAPSEMTVPAGQLDREFFALAEMEGVTDVDKLNQVLDRVVGLRTFLTADDRIEKVAEFVAQHFLLKVLPLGYKAFLVGVNREACAKYKRALDKLLPPEWSVPVYSENTSDVVERPLVAELQLSEEQEKDVRLAFKKANDVPKILIVTDKLLTGFDAPLLYCMYLDKPMRDHVLLQAIARVNRPYVDGEGNSKPIGLVVDFVGVLRELRKALQFDSSDVSGAIEDLDLLMHDFQDKIVKAKANHLDYEEGGRVAETRTDGWSTSCTRASSTPMPAKGSSRTTRRSSHCGRYSRRPPNCGDTSTHSSVWPTSTLSFATHTQTALHLWQNWPTRPSGWWKSRQRCMDWAISPRQSPSTCAHLRRSGKSQVRTRPRCST